MKVFVFFLIKPILISSKFFKNYRYSKIPIHLSKIQLKYAQTALNRQINFFVLSRPEIFLDHLRIYPRPEEVN